MEDTTQQQPAPSIPVEAVEAAVRTLTEFTPEEDADSFDLKANGVWRGKVEKILEAAAPYMQGTVKPEKEISTGALIRQLLDETKADGS